MDLWIWGALFTALIGALIETRRNLRARGHTFRGAHVIITGGSSGLGLALAKKLACAGSNVTLMSRSATKLQAAADEVEKFCKQQNSQHGKVVSVPCDVSNYDAMVAAAKTAQQLQKQPCTILVCCAGTAVPGMFLEQDMNVFRQQMDLNYFGCLHACKAIVPQMISSGQKSSIVLVSSALGLLGIYGYTAYVPTKFALRGLAECLQQELKPHDIRVSIFYPGNMITPGFEEEEKTKPEITKRIEGTSAAVTPEQAADCLANKMKKGDFAITNEFVLELMRIGSNGVAPSPNFVMDVILYPIVLIARVVFAVDVWRALSSARDTKKTQ